MFVFCVLSAVMISKCAAQISPSSENTSTPINCGNNFTGPADIIFLLDASRSIGRIFDADPFNLKSFLDSFIRRALLIGPDPDSGYVRLAMVKFTQSAYETLFDFISEPIPVYESELLAPLGVFETRVNYREPAGIEMTTNLAAVQEANKIFNKHPEDIQTRHKILFLASDALFRNDTADAYKNRVRDALRNLRKALIEDNGSMDMYGIGIGPSYVKNNLRLLVDSANGEVEPCRTANLSEWQKYINNLPEHPAKITLGKRRYFTGGYLCCDLCGQKEDAVANCSVEEFYSDFTLESLGRLQCTSLGIMGECVRTTEATSTVTEVISGISVRKGDMSFSVVAVLFGVVNLILMVMFILVCIFAHKIGPKRPTDIEQQDKQENHQRQSVNPYTTSNESMQSPSSTSTADPTNQIMSPKVNVPTRQAPRVPPSDQDIHTTGTFAQDAEYLEPVSSEAQEYSALPEDRNRDYENIDFQPRTYIDIFKKDMMNNLQKVKRYSGYHTRDTEAGQAKSPALSPLSTSTLQTSIPLQPSSETTNDNDQGKKRQSPFKNLLNKSSKKNETYENVDFIQKLHDNKLRKNDGLDNRGVNMEADN